MLLGGVGPWGQSHAAPGTASEAPVQGDGEVQEGIHQLGCVAVGQHCEGLQAALLGLGDADGAKLQVDGLAQAGHLWRKGEEGRWKPEP